MFVWVFMCQPRYLCMYLVAGAVGGGGAGWGAARGAQAPAPGPPGRCRPRSPPAGVGGDTHTTGPAPSRRSIPRRPRGLCKEERGRLPARLQERATALLKLAVNILLAKLSGFSKNCLHFLIATQQGSTVSLPKGFHRLRGVKPQGRLKASRRRENARDLMVRLTQTLHLLFSFTFASQQAVIHAWL